METRSTGVLTTFPKESKAGKTSKKKKEVYADESRNLCSCF